MRKIEPALTKDITQHIGSKTVGKAPPYQINTYRQLVEQVAYLSYLNKDQLLFFRGQTQDFINKAGVSTFYPSIYREDNLQEREIVYRFEVLDQASRQLRDLFTDNKIDGHNDVSRKRYIQWSILQHYGVCNTPLLDFTHSLRVACSFAQLSDAQEKGFVYVFGLPYITNRISINSDRKIHLQGTHSIEGICFVKVGATHPLPSSLSSNTSTIHPRSCQAGSPNHTPSLPRRSSLGRVPAHSSNP